MVDRRAQHQLGDLVCDQHGLITEPAAGVIPACPRCQRGLLKVVASKKFGTTYAESIPAYCAGPDRHPLVPGRVLVGWEPCGCTPARGHMRWRCRAAGCGDVQQHPPCTRTDGGEQYRPGWQQGSHGSS